MTSTRLDQYRLASHPDVAGIVKAAVISAAIAIRNEDPETPNHPNRIVLSNTVFADLGHDASDTFRAFTWLAAMNTTIQTVAVVDGVVQPELILDADVDFVVASCFDQIAGDQ